MDTKCLGTGCQKVAVRKTRAGRFCLIHFVAWKNEVIAAGGSDSEVEYQMLGQCAYCKIPGRYPVDENCRCDYCAKRHPKETEPDNVNHPAHYNSHPNQIECIAVVEHMNFCLGNAIKYIWRSAEKGGIEDLKKAQWYIAREIAKQKKA